MTHQYETVFAIAWLALTVMGVFWVGYMHGSTMLDVRSERAKQRQLWRHEDAYELSLKAPDEALQAIVSALREDGQRVLANAVDAMGIALVDWRHDETERASKLHRRAQKAEGLLARREADLTKTRDRASRMHRRAQKAEGALRRLKWKVLKNGCVGILSAEDHDAFANDVAAYLGRNDGYPYQRKALQDSLKARTQVDVHESGNTVAIGVRFDPKVPATTHGVAGTFDVVPAAKPLSDVTPKQPVTAMPGLDLSGLTGPLKCHATLPSGLLNYEPVVCRRESGHEGPHSSDANGSRVEWGFFIPFPEDEETPEAE